MPETMLAARLNLSGSRPQLTMDPVPVPTPGPGQVLLRVKAAGVCLSDAHLLEGVVRPVHLSGDRVTLGHEVAGVVVDRGPGVTGFDDEAHVIVYPGRPMPDGTVHTMGLDYDGGWAEYLVADAAALLRYPASISPEVAAIIPDAVSTPWAAITDTSSIRAGQSVGVWGVGGLGAHMVALLRMIGAAPIVAIDPLPAARQRAIALGADLALSPTDEDFDNALRAATSGAGLDVAFDMAGVPSARHQALAHLGRTGELVLVGVAGQKLSIPHEVNFLLKKQRVLGHFGSSLQSLKELIHLVGHARIDLTSSISGLFPLSEAPTAVEHLVQKTGDPIRIILRP